MLQVVINAAIGKIYNDHVKAKDLAYKVQEITLYEVFRFPTFHTSKGEDFGGEKAEQVTS